MVQEVQMLNKKIENINIQRTKAEARVEMLKKQLTQGVAEYKKTYGVDLSDKSFPKLSGKVTAELSKVSGDIKAEYELKSKVVNAIEEGNYEEAYKLLGIEAESTEEVVEVEDTTQAEDVEIDLDLGIEEEEEVEEAEEEETTEAQEEIDMSVEEDDGDFNFGVVLDEEEEEEVEAPKVEEETGIKGQGALEAVMEMTVEDDDDDISIPSMEDDDFGFGDILNGTKFQK